MKIGIFDSGVGGISVLHQAMRRMPGAEFLFYADENHVPYGSRSRDEITQYTTDAVSFLLQRGCSAVVIACNTATSAAITALRERFDVPIIGMEPAVKKALELYPDSRVLVAATPVTIQGEKLHELIRRVDKHERVHSVALPKLVDFAQRGEFTSPAVLEYLKSELSGLPLEEYAALVLGCTHFNYFKDAFRAVMPSAHFTDGNEGTINRLISETGFFPRPGKEAGVSFFLSGVPVTQPQELERINACFTRLEAMLKIQ